jgi:hypothetical protein
MVVAGKEGLWFGDATAAFRAYVGLFGAVFELLGIFTALKPSKEIVKAGCLCPHEDTKKGSQMGALEGSNR